MRRVLFSALIALVFVACLDPDKPYLAKEDEVAPTVVRSKPAIGTVTDIVNPSDPLVVVFSEEMDVRSLRPGISVRRDNADIEIDVFAQGDGGVATNSEADFTGQDRPYSVAVRRTGGALWETTGSYILRLNTLLIDTEGNPLAQQIDIRFQAQGDAGTP